MACADGFDGQPRLSEGWRKRLRPSATLLQHPSRFLTEKKCTTCSANSKTTMTACFLRGAAVDCSRAVKLVEARGHVPLHSMTPRHKCAVLTPPFLHQRRSRPKTGGRALSEKTPRSNSTSAESPRASFRRRYAVGGRTPSRQCETCSGKRRPKRA